MPASICAVALAAASAAGAPPMMRELSGPNAPIRSPDDAGLAGTFPGAPFAFLAGTEELIPRAGWR